VFHNASHQTTEWMNLTTASVHGQMLCIQGALTLYSREKLKEIQSTIETVIGAVVNSARAELGISPIVPDASFIERWGQGQLSNEERARFREDQLKKLEKGNETMDKIRKQAAAGDPEAIEWVARQLSRLEEGRETMRQKRLEAEAGDKEAIKWRNNQMRGLDQGGRRQGTSTANKNRKDDAETKAKARVRELSKEGQFTLGKSSGNVAILYQRNGEKKKTALSKHNAKAFAIGQKQIKVAQEEVSEIWKENGGGDDCTVCAPCLHIPSCLKQCNSGCPNCLWSKSRDSKRNSLCRRMRMKLCNELNIDKDHDYITFWLMLMLLFPGIEFVRESTLVSISFDNVDISEVLDMTRGI
jgi:hypothetical protein